MPTKTMRNVQPESDTGLRRAKLRFPGIYIGVMLCVAIAAIVLYILISRSSRIIQSRSNAPSGSASSDSSNSIRLRGRTEAVEKRAIQVPLLNGETWATLTIIKLTHGGTMVKRGDILVEFDHQSQLRDFLDKQAASNNLVNQLTAAEQNEKAARAKDETEMKVAEDSLGKAQLEIQKVAILSRIDVEKAQGNLEGAKATFAQLQQTFDLKRKAAQAAIRILQIQLERNRETMAYAQQNAASLSIHSPLDGIVVLNTIWKQGSMAEVQEGDQLRPGIKFMEVVDPSRMEVQVPVNQEDLSSLTIGETAPVRLDAYPGLTFQGRLENIGPMGRTGDFSNKVRTFSAVFSIVGHDPRLMPDLSAAVDVASMRTTSAVHGLVR